MPHCHVAFALSNKSAHAKRILRAGNEPAVCPGIHAFLQEKGLRVVNVQDSAAAP